MGLGLIARGEQQKEIDLNLLRVFAMVVQEGSLSLAAKRLQVSQPTVSQALSRFRAITKDPLFKRGRNGVTPTARALALYHELLPALNAIEAALYSDAVFDPARSRASFRVLLPEAFSVSVGRSLLDRAQKTAPSVTIELAFGNASEDPFGLLEQDEYDLVIARERRPSKTRSWHRQSPLPPSPVMCLYDAKRLAIPSPISLDHYVALAHVLAPCEQETDQAINDALHGHPRKASIMIDDYAGIPIYLKSLDALAHFPLHSARVFSECCDLTMSPLPIPVGSVSSSLYWHGRHDADLGHQWLRDLVVELADRLATL